MIENNAHLNVVGGPERSTPLHLAVSEDLAAIVKLLLEFNADPNRVDKNGKTASQLTANPTILKVIEKAKKRFQKEDESFELTLPPSK